MKVTEEIELMIDDCMRRELKLSEWERNFIQSIYEKESLTDAQIAKLENIWDKVT